MHLQQTVQAVILKLEFSSEILFFLLKFRRDVIIQARAGTQRYPPAPSFHASASIYVPDSASDFQDKRIGGWKEGEDPSVFS